MIYTGHVMLLESEIQEAVIGRAHGCYVVGKEHIQNLDREPLWKVVRSPRGR